MSTISEDMVNDLSEIEAWNIDKDEDGYLVKIYGDTDLHFGLRETVASGEDEKLSHALAKALGSSKGF